MSAPPGAPVRRPQPRAAPPVRRRWPRCSPRRRCSPVGPGSCWRRWLRSSSSTRDFYALLARASARPGCRWPSGPTPASPGRGRRGADRDRALGDRSIPGTIGADDALGTSSARPDHRDHRPGRLLPGRAAARKGYEVHGIVRRSSQLQHRADRPPLPRPPRGRACGCSSTTATSPTRLALAKLIYELQPDEIYNLGAQSHVASPSNPGVHGRRRPARAPCGCSRRSASPGSRRASTRRPRARCTAPPRRRSGDDAVPPPQPLRRRQGRRLLDGGELPRGLRDVRRQRDPLQPRVPAPRRDLRHPQDHPRASPGSRPACRTSSTSATSTPARLGLRRRLRRGDVADARSRRARRLRDRDRRDALGARVPRARRSSAPASTGRSTSRSTRATSARPRSMRCCGDASKAREKLGWEPTVALRRAGRDHGRRRLDALADAARRQGHALQPRGHRMTARSRDPGFWAGKRVVVTGGAGFLGQADRGAARGRRRRGPRRPLGRARPARPGARAARRVDGADVVIHLAARVGGIGFNRRNPAPLAYDNLMMGANVFEAVAARGRREAGRRLLGLRLPEAHRRSRSGRRRSGTATRRSRTRRTGWRRRCCSCSPTRTGASTASTPARR